MPTKLYSPFLKDAQKRGLLFQCTNLESLDRQLEQNSEIPFYLGFDATAQSLHVGNLLILMVARLGAIHGLKPILLLGGGTTRVGDPTGKTEMRKILEDDTIFSNSKKIEHMLRTLVPSAQIVNNFDWLSQLNYLDFLKNVGRHFSINRMLTFDSVKERLEREQPLSFLEFNYMVLQAYDFLHLSQTQDCFMQVGGADQWGNIVNGVDLIRRVTGKEAFGLTSPLLTTASGTKMGKTTTGALWLDSELVSPFEFWQFWRNTEDKDVCRFLNIFTELPEDQIEALCALDGAALNEAKKVLADCVTGLIHGDKEAAAVKATAEIVFEEHQPVEEIEILEIQGNTVLTSCKLPCIRLSGEENVVEALCTTSLTTSRSEARRLIAGKGARINDQLIEDPTLLLNQIPTGKNQLLKLSAGRKKHSLVFLG